MCILGEYDSDERFYDATHSTISLSVWKAQMVHIQDSEHNICSVTDTRNSLEVQGSSGFKAQDSEYNFCGIQYLRNCRKTADHKNGEKSGGEIGKFRVYFLRCTLCSKHSENIRNREAVNAEMDSMSKFRAHFLRCNLWTEYSGNIEKEREFEPERTQKLVVDSPEMNVNRVHRDDRGRHIAVAIWQFLSVDS